MVYFFDKERTHSRHATELLSCRSHCVGTLHPSFLWNQLLWRSGSWDKSELAACTYHNFFVKKIIKVQWCLQSHVTTECSTKLNGPLDVCLFYSFYDCDLTTLISLVLFPANLIFVAYQKCQDSYVSTPSFWNEFLLINQCHGIVNKIFSLSFFSDWNIPMSNL